jgi:hypothetical protein
MSYPVISLFSENADFIPSPEGTGASASFSLRVFTPVFNSHAWQLALCGFVSHPTSGRRTPCAHSAGSAIINCV